MRLKPGSFAAQTETFSDSTGTTTRQRVTKVSATLQQGTGTATPRDGNVQPIALKASNGTIDARLYDTDRGHLIAIDFGGPEDPKNLVPMWGTFNRCGRWKEVERELVTWVEQQSMECVVTIAVAYPTSTTVDDPRIPIAFQVSVQTVAAQNPASRTWPIIDHRRPVPDNRPDASLKLQLTAAKAEMEGNSWRIEDHLDWNNFPSYRPFPSFTSGARPYAVLDYLDYKELVARVGADRAKVEMANRMQSTGFTEVQRERILAANRALNDGHLVSDDSNDSVRTDLKHRPLGTPEGVLIFHGGSDSAPQVDHIIPESRSGTNAYSNAQVLSSAYNNALRAAISGTDAQQLQANLAARPKGRERKAPDRLGIEPAIKKATPKKDKKKQEQQIANAVAATLHLKLPANKKPARK
jgi:hypothetical protein